ncbi:hypothetical protein PAECIP111893_03535 [Paenibacillus plantiphilus]|uniref:Uncharacterized protein n=1 Tax=Paenibacillus plantiphilus TaxID=2905650 RepID=A0ABN8GRI7_9BACL|nr:DUF2179 domain-containing protein [Paenibacillus plantiphilus]CAH1212428.1 hypothetical protein PAECIP111893_03535 [Paenibacillus plantiphilus]
MRHVQESIWSKGMVIQRSGSGSAAVGLALLITLGMSAGLEGLAGPKGTAAAGIMQSAATYVIVLGLAFVAAYHLAKRSSSTRMMQISSMYADEIDEAIRQTINREVVRVASRSIGDGEMQHTMQMLIYRLEERTVKDLIQSIDPDAIVSVIPMHRWRQMNEDASKPESRTRAKLQRSDRMPPVSKYGNKFTDG